MAVAASSIAPADGAVNVWPNAPVSCFLSDATDLDPDLVEVEVNGISCTLSNGLLSCVPQGDVSGGALVEDYTNLEVQTLAEWYSGEGAVTATIRYDAGDVDDTTFTPVDPEGLDVAGDAILDAYAVAIDEIGPVGADIEWEVVEHYYGGTYDVQFIVDELSRHVGGDVTWICGHRYLDRFHGSGLVGGLQVVRWTASGIVEGWRLDRAHGSGIVQGWKIERSRASGVVGVAFLYRGQASGLVGIEVLRRVAASGVVYGVNRNNVLEVHVLDESTYDVLVAAGVTWA